MSKVWFAVAGAILITRIDPVKADGSMAAVIAIQRAIIAAADANDGPALKAAMSQQLVLRYGVLEGGKLRWGETNREHLLARWTQKNPRALPTLISDQRAVVSGPSATVFACITDRTMRADGSVDATFTRVMDSFTLVQRRWLWMASMEVQADSCPASLPQ